jgi:hypothetical protein
MFLVLALFFYSLYVYFELKKYQLLFYNLKFYHAIPHYRDGLQARIIHLSARPGIERQSLHECNDLMLH